VIATIADHTHEVAEAFQGPDISLPTWLFWYLAGCVTPITFYFMSKR